MESLIEFVKEWGYWAVFLGSLIEGESVILTASALASQQYLSIFKIAIIAFIGTTIADQLLYFVGRYYGDALFNRFEKLKGPSEKAFALLHKYDIWFIIACRFIYGIRVASAIVIGASKITPARFVPLNILSAFIWATVSCTTGYYLGMVILHIFERSETVQKTIIIGVCALVALIYILKKAFTLFKNSVK